MSKEELEAERAAVESDLTALEVDLTNRIELIDAQMK